MHARDEQHPLDDGAQLGVRRAGRLQEGCALRGLDGERALEDRERLSGLTCFGQGLGGSVDKCRPVLAGVLSYGDGSGERSSPEPTLRPIRHGQSAVSAFFTCSSAATVSSVETTALAMKRKLTMAAS